MRLVLRHVRVLRHVHWAAAVLLLAAVPASAQHHGNGNRHHGGWGGGWGYPGGGFSFGSFGGLSYGRVAYGGYLPFSYGYTSYGGLGYGLPAGGFGPYYGYSSLYGYPNFGPYYNYVPMGVTAPVVPPIVQQPPPVLLPPGNPTIEELIRQQQPNGNANAQPRQTDVAIFAKPSNAEAKRKSMHYQAQGDEWFLKQNYLQAFARYKQAYAAATDRPEPRFRMALALAGTANYGMAVDELKRLSQLDPQWPAHADRLDEVFGADRMIAKNIVLQKVAEWVREDVRDPDRLYLLGVLLYFNEDADKAQLLFETAGLLSGDPQHVRVFLGAAQPPGPQPPVPQPPGVQPAKLPDNGAPVPHPPQVRTEPSRPDEPDPAPRIAGRTRSFFDQPLRAERDVR